MTMRPPMSTEATGRGRQMRRPRLVLLVLTLTLGFAAVFGAPSASAAGVQYAVGDVLAGDASGLIKHFSATGVLLDTLNTGSNSAEQTGMCFGESGNLRSTNFTANNMTLFDNMGNVLTPSWGGPFNQHPESCVLNAVGDIYVGQADGSRDVLKFSPGGSLLGSFNVATGPRGSDWIDLAGDQCTLFYTSEGNTIRRFDVCGNAQLPDFVAGFTAPGSSSECYALRIRINGEVMVACTDKIYRLSTTGTVIQSYPLPAGETSFLFAMNLDPDNATFWTAGYNSGNIYRISLAYADTNTNNVQNLGEPGDTATKLWVLPASTPGCKVTYGGRITAASGDKATFGGNAMVQASGPKGQEEYQDHGPVINLNVHSIDVLSVTCSADGKSASIFGTATVNGSGSVSFRIDLTDNGEPG